MNLYPFNLYFLYATLAILIVFLFVTLVKIKSFKKTTKNTLAITQQMNQTLALGKIKANALKEKSEKNKKRNDMLKILVPILIASRAMMKNRDDLRGVSGYVKATRTQMKVNHAAKRLINTLKK